MTWDLITSYYPGRSRSKWYTPEEDEVYKRKNKSKLRKRGNKVRKFMAITADDKIYLNINNTFNVIEAKTMQANKVKSGFNMESLYITGGSIWGLAHGFWTLTPVLFRSQNFGENWQKMHFKMDYCPSQIKKTRVCRIDEKNYKRYMKLYPTSIPHFWNSSIGYLIAKIKVPINKRSKGVYPKFLKRNKDDQTIIDDDAIYFFKTTNAGTSWKVLPDVELPEGCHKLIPQVNPSELLLACYGGSLYLSKDEGKTWKIDREQNL